MKINNSTRLLLVAALASELLMWPTGNRILNGHWPENTCKTSTTYTALTLCFGGLGVLLSIISLINSIKLRQRTQIIVSTVAVALCLIAAPLAYLLFTFCLGFGGS